MRAAVGGVHFRRAGERVREIPPRASVSATKTPTAKTGTEDFGPEGTKSRKWRLHHNERSEVEEPQGFAVGVDHPRTFRLRKPHARLEEWGAWQNQDDLKRFLRKDGL